MNARVAAMATYVGSVRDGRGVAVEPDLDEVAMAVNVAREAAEHPAQRGEPFDAIIFASSGIRHVFPSGAAAIAEALGLNCLAFDITAGCTSMGIAVEVAARAASRSLVVCADVLSRTIDPTDQSHVPLLSFADGAAAIVIRHDPGGGPTILSCRSKTVGRWRDFYSSKHGRIVRSLPPECKKDLGAAYLQAWTEIGRELIALCPAGSAPWVYANQGDATIFPSLMAALNLPEDILIRTSHGHAGGADPWIGLQAQPAPRGSRALLLASGIGFTFHGTLLEMA
jgi:3-oxoacyl-[acyl-carrier-protein] synthase III